MSAYKYIQRSFAESYATRSPQYRARIHAWRKGQSIVRIEKPSNIARAHALGYRARKDFVVARVRMPKGKRRRGKPDQGRKPGKTRKFENPGRSWQWFAEQRAARRFPNLRVVNSYWVGEDGSSQYYEVILRNPFNNKSKKLVARQAPPATVAKPT